MAELTTAEKKVIKDKFTEDFREYARIDYDDDASTLDTIIDAAAEELAELIPNYDFYAMTARQRLLTMMKTLNLYDERRTHADTVKVPLSGYSSMLLKEIYGGADNE